MNIVKEHILFPTLVLQVKEILSKNECDEILQLIKNGQYSLHTHNALKGENTLSSYKENNHNIVYDFKNLHKKILKYSLDYADKSGFAICNQITNSWLNVESKGSSLKKHSHPNCVLSGVIFIKCDYQSRPLYFYNPNSYITYSRIKDYKPYSYEWFKFLPKQGDVLIFPSWLHHGSNEDINLSNERVVISFNIV
jgi:uncharacterized protein (TIGR02466 family)